jgi:hypothetical protein
MKPHKSLIIILSILLLDSSFFYSQLSGAELGKVKGGYAASLSYGHARQFSDVPSAGGGWGMNLAMGKNLYYDTDALLAFDLIGNVFFNQTKGLETDEVSKPFVNELIKKSDYNTFFMNYKTSMGGIGIDGKLTFNKFREEKNWYGALSLGGNWGIYSAKMDMEDAAGKTYKTQFDQIKNLKDSEKKQKLKEILDGKYETKAEDFGLVPLKSTLMPSLCLEMGYDITDFLTIFVSNKLFLGASNKIDGEIHIDDNKDKLNYLNLGLNVYFGNKTKSIPQRRNYQSVPENKVETGYKIPKEVEDHNFPEVKIIVPEERSFTSNKKKIEVKAKITNITSALDIYCKVNDEKVNFDFNANFVNFFAELKPGENKIQVYGKNEEGQSRDVITVIYDGMDEPKPIITLVDPPAVKFKSDADVFTIKAILDNIKGKENIKILANDYEMKSFNYNENTKEFKIKVRLAEGQNNFQIIAINALGSTTQTFDIYYKAEIPDEQTGGIPEIDILSPGSDQKTEIEGGIIDFKANVKGIKTKSDLSFTVNGIENTKFIYDSETGTIVDKINLVSGETTIKITAFNIYGESSNEVTVFYEKKNEATEKNINFIDISKPDFDCMVNMSVKIKGAINKKELKLFLNENEVFNFSFSTSTEILKSTLYLDEGDNTIKVAFTKNNYTESEYITAKCLLGDTIPVNENTDIGGNNETSSVPAIEVISPQNSAKVESEMISFKAKVENIENKDAIRIALNDNPIYDFLFDNESKLVSAEVILIEGVNNIYISAENGFGKFEKTVSVSFEEALAGPPAVLINSPRNGFRTEEKTVIFRATIQNVKKPDDISVTLNGKTFTDYNYDAERSIIFGNIPISLGENKIVVEATNRLGSDRDEVAFSNRVEFAPAVRITSPKNGVIFGVAYAPIEAIVQNVKKSTSIVIYINGEANRSLKLTNEKLESTIPLKKGENKIIVKATNEFGSATDSLKVYFGGKPAIPVITFINPLKSGTTVGNNQFKFEAKITGINHSSNVELYLNDILINDIYYYKKESKVTAELKLMKGMNIIRVVASNDSGIDQQSIRVDY